MGNGCKIPSCRHLINNGAGCGHPDTTSDACPLTESEFAAAISAERRRGQLHGRHAYDAHSYESHERQINDR